MRYVNDAMGIGFSLHSLRVSYSPSEGSVVIDPSTIRSLELIQNVENHKSKQCLFGLLNQTLTPMGARRLRMFILQPSTDAEKIYARLDAVEELTTNAHAIYAARQGLSIKNDWQSLTRDSSQGLGGFRESSHRRESELLFWYI
jgi:DNA mismatch repair protein MSH4